MATKSLHSLIVHAASVYTTLTEVRTAFAADCEQIAKHLHGKTRDEARVALLPHIAKVYTLGTKDGQRGLTFDYDAEDAAAVKRWEAARKFLQELLTHCGYGQPGNAQVEPPRGSLSIIRDMKQRGWTKQQVLAAVAAVYAKA